MQIITHRGLDAENHHSYTESSREAFTYFLEAGFGIEFDVRITKDRVPVISHDESLARLTGTETSKIAGITATEFLNTKLPNGHPLLLTELIGLMREYANQNNSVHAVHLKYQNQTRAELEVLIPYLSQLSDLPIMLFDVTPEVAKKLKERLPSLSLAASVAHPYDIKRYNDAVGGTLVSVADMSEYTDLYDWIWLDEWDLTAERDDKKTLYNEETFSYLRALGYKIALVSPELHATSPQLLGGESHQDGCDKISLEKRWHKLIELSPDAMCTDYPHRVEQLMS